MSNSVKPFVLATISGALLAPLPLFLLWRLKANANATTFDIRITYTIILCIALLNIAESAKASYFGLEYYNYELLFNFMQVFTNVSDRTKIRLIAFISSELAHMLFIAAVFQRWLELLQPPSHFDQFYHTMRKVMAAFVFVIRLSWPIVCWLGGAVFGMFGNYQISVLYLESTLLFICTIGTFRYLRQLYLKQEVSLPNWVLYSNPIVTGTLLFFNIMWIILLLLGSYKEIDTELKTPQITIPFLAMSLNSLTLAYILAFFYQDTKSIILEPKTPYSGKGMKRVKFSLSSLLS